MVNIVYTEIYQDWVWVRRHRGHVRIYERAAVKEASGVADECRALQVREKEEEIFLRKKNTLEQITHKKCTNYTEYKKYLSLYTYIK